METDWMVFVEFYDMIDLYSDKNMTTQFKVCSLEKRKHISFSFNAADNENIKLLYWVLMIYTWTCKDMYW